MNGKLAIRGDLLDFTAAPEWGGTGMAGVRWRPDHWLLVEAGRIVGAQPACVDLAGDWGVAMRLGKMFGAG